MSADFRGKRSATLALVFVEKTSRDAAVSSPLCSANESLSVYDLPQTIEIPARAASFALLVAAENARIGVRKPPIRLKVVEKLEALIVWI